MTSRTQVLHYCEACGQPVDHFDQPLDLHGVRVDDFTLSYAGRNVSLPMAGTVLLFRQLVLKGRISKEAFATIKESTSDQDQTSVYAFYLRKALGELGAPLTIRTVYGWGYELLHAGKPVVNDVVDMSLVAGSLVWPSLSRGRSDGRVAQRPVLD